ncbi:hypothetical protein LSTR_LSTR009575 [Laodelphax striatellus]|uniref:DUF7041 domain-containing protein n=1 Tax=Laodelphax striatellus TaxID=195883 RepID=A0A482WQ50_LAOST|nr:hypothetical protein LSTR_LSTR009575 [Laodelphax striatellus]
MHLGGVSRTKQASSEEFIVTSGWYESAKERMDPLQSVPYRSGRCNYWRTKWALADDQSCDCGAPTQTMSHIIEECPLRLFPGESQFTLSNNVNEVTKFHHVVSQLDQRTAFEVEDVIANPPPLNPYSFLRDKIIERLSASEEQRVRQLISAEELGDRKLRSFFVIFDLLLCTTIVQDNFLRQLWLPRLPPNVQAILASQAELTLDKPQN